MHELKKHKAAIVISAIILIAAIIAVAVLPSVMRRVQINDQFEIAQQYLNDLDYESALLAFTKILEIDPRNEDALQALQDTYLAYIRSELEKGNTDHAIALMADMKNALGLTEDPFIVAVTKEPTCGTAGHEIWTCNLNDDVLERDTPATEAHIWNDGMVTTAATCAAEGILTYSCVGCEAEKTEVLAMLPEHSWDNGSVTTEATYQNDGVMTYTCSVCQSEKTETIPMLIDEVLVVNDKNLEAALREEINKPTGTLMVSDFENLTVLDLEDNNISDWSPVAHVETVYGRH
mgnify:CR=1 FL=1